MRVWLVGSYSCGSREVWHICKTKQLAKKRLFEIRDRLIAGWEELKKVYRSEDNEKGVQECLDMIDILSSPNYKEWEVCPRETPFIEEMEVEEEIK